MEIGKLTKEFYELSKTVRGDANPLLKNPLRKERNIAQLIIHVTFEDDSVYSIPILSKITSYKKIQAFNGLFYISGSEGTKIGVRPKQLFEGKFTSYCMENINNNNILFIQREQPNYECLYHRFTQLSCLENLFFPYGSFTDDLLQIKNIAKNCQCQIQLIYERSDYNQNEMKRELEKLKKSQLEPIANQFPNYSLISSNIEILQQMIDSLKAKDFSFMLLSSGYSSVYNDLIQKTLFNLYKGNDPKTIFNPKSCNFYCSEQLLLDEEFGNKIMLINLSQLVMEKVSNFEKKVKGLTVQIDSTKAPCKICTIDIVQNTILEGGYIYEFFQMFPKIDDDSKNIVISYHEPYNEDMGFRIANNIEEYNHIFSDQTPKIFIMEVSTL